MLQMDPGRSNYLRTDSFFKPVCLMSEDLIRRCILTFLAWQLHFCQQLFQVLVLNSFTSNFRHMFHSYHFIYRFQLKYAVCLKKSTSVNLFYKYNILWKTKCQSIIAKHWFNASIFSDFNKWTTNLFGALLLAWLCYVCNWSRPWINEITNT